MKVSGLRLPRPICKWVPGVGITAKIVGSWLFLSNDVVFIICRYINGKLVFTIGYVSLHCVLFLSIAIAPPIGDVCDLQFPPEGKGDAHLPPPLSRVLMSMCSGLHGSFILKLTPSQKWR